jgi:hypothetical protein
MSGLDFGTLRSNHIASHTNMVDFAESSSHSNSIQDPYFWKTIMGFPFSN